MRRRRGDEGVEGLVWRRVKGSRVEGGGEGNRVDLSGFQHERLVIGDMACRAFFNRQFAIPNPQ
jgi:hypothetical protein